MIKTLLLTTLIVAICMVLMAVTILIKEMRRRGIKCVEAQDKDARRDNHHAIPEREKKNNN